MEHSLKTIPLFRTIPSEVLHTVAPRCETHRFRKGGLLFKEGQPAEGVWLVRRGWVYLVKQTPQGTLATIAVMTPDDGLCGVSAFGHGRYAASAVAATDTQLIRIPTDVFEHLLETHPAFAKAVLLTCCRRIHHMAEAISLSQAPVEQRMAYTLLRLQSAFGKTIPVTHQELARMAGTRWETSIRTLSSMRRRGWVASSRGRVTTLAPDKLRALIYNGSLQKVR